MSYKSLTKLISTFLFILINIRMAVGQVNTTPVSSFPVKLYRSILRADEVVYGRTTDLQTLKNSNSVSMLLKSVKDLETGSPIPSILHIIVDQRYSFGDPIVPLDQEQVLFIKKYTGDIPNTKNGLRLDGNLYSVCDGEESAIPVTLPSDSVITKYIAERYDIHSSADIIEKISFLSKWKVIEDTKGKVDYLISLLSKNGESLIYSDNVPPLLAAVVLFDGKFEKINDEFYYAIKPSIFWRQSPVKRRLINRLVTLVNSYNNKGNADSVKIMIAIASKMGIEIEDQGGKYDLSKAQRRSVQADGKVSLQVGPLPE